MPGATPYKNLQECKSRLGINLGNEFRQAEKVAEMNELLNKWKVCKIPRLN